MARILDINSGEANNAENSEIIELQGNDNNEVSIPAGHFVGDADLSRDSQDLILKFSNGDSFSVKDYFSQNDDSLIIQDSAGSILNTGLVHSFLESSNEYAQNLSATDESPVGAVEELKGDATVTRLDGTTEPMTLGTPIYNGDIIETSGDGAVNITFLDETSMAISENARVSIDDYQFDPDTESGTTDLSVLRGVFVYTSGLIGRDDPDDVEINTPVGSIGIRGTIIAGNINPEGNSEISVLEGAIVVKNGAGEHTLSQQYETVKLSGFQDVMEYKGVEAANDIGKTYGSVSDVLPKLFSSINDAAKEEAKVQDTKQESENEAELEAVEEEVVEAKAEESAEEHQETITANDVPVTAQDAQFETLKTQNQKPDAKDGKNDFRLQNNNDGKVSATTQNEANNANEVFYQNTDTTTNEPRIVSHFKPLFEKAKAGDVIGVIKLENYPSGADVQFDGSTPSSYVINQIAGTNIFEIALTADITDSVGNTVESATLKVVFANGNETVIDIINPEIVDASVNLIPEEHNLYRHITSQDTAETQAPEQIDTNNNGTFTALTTGQKNIGDVDGDGKSDYIDDTTVHKAGGTDTLDTSALSGISFVDGIGDVNGGGKSDVLVANANKAQIFTDGSNTAGLTIDPTGTIIAASAAGDINGDGYDDFALSIDNGTDVDTYVVYGKSGGLTGGWDTSDLEDPDNALKIHHAGVGGGGATGYTLTDLGDVNGDGFDDIQLGVGNTYFTVHGQAGRDVITDGSAGDGNGNDGFITAKNNLGLEQALAGDVHFNDGGYINVSMKGGNSNNIFQINNDDFGVIDGGDGFDTIKYIQNGGIDFSTMNFEKIEQIEAIEFGGTSQSITLTAENIFNLLKSSDNKELWIKGTGNLNLSGSTIENALEGFNGDTSSVTTSLNETHTEQSSNEFTHYQIGDYNLYVEESVTVV